MTTDNQKIVLEIESQTPKLVDDVVRNWWANFFAGETKDSNVDQCRLEIKIFRTQNMPRNLTSKINFELE